MGERDALFCDALVGLAECCREGRMGDSGAKETLRLDCLRGFGFGVASMSFWELSVLSRVSISTLVDLTM